LFQGINEIFCFLCRGRQNHNITFLLSRYIEPEICRAVADNGDGSADLWSYISTEQKKSYVMILTTSEQKTKHQPPQEAINQHKPQKAAIDQH
jgi:hypothetical protein